MELYPMALSPCCKEALWGGTGLKLRFRRTEAPDRTAESWELADHPAGRCRVARGTCRGMTLGQLGEMDRERYWGTQCPEGPFPILVKLLDAEQELSVQVHPSEEQADRSRGEQGKAELWYVVDCRPRAWIGLGLCRKLDRDRFLAAARDGSIAACLNRVPVAPGDVFYVRPGTIHQVGAGVLLAEIQQSSDTTFRIYDGGRLQPDGTPRLLQPERAAQVLDYDPLIPAECRANSRASFPGFAMTELFSCPSFRACCLDVRTGARLACDGTSFCHLLCVAGTGLIRQGGRDYTMEPGQSYFMPAALGEYEVLGNCRVLLTRL